MIDTNELMRGCKLSVTQAATGAWYAYVTLPVGTPHDLFGPGARPYGGGGDLVQPWNDYRAETEAGARSLGCEVLGRYFAHRLALAMSPQRVVQETSSTREVKF